MVRWIFIIGILFIPFRLVAADEPKTLIEKEKELKVMLDSLRGAKNNLTRNAFNVEFKKTLLEVIAMEGSFAYAFDSLTSIGKVRSPDNVFRLFNWNVENDDHSQNYYCLILIQGKGKKTKIVDCIDKSNSITKPDNKVLDPKLWYGCLYYKIIISKESPVTQYTLLGWDLYSEASSKRIIEIMTIKGEKITFGDPAFNIENVGIKRRIVLEYNAKAHVSLKYNSETQIITYDHLIPEAAFSDGLYEFYIPDGSIDGFQLQEDGTWLYIPDVDARREKDDSDKLYNEPR